MGDLAFSTDPLKVTLKVTQIWGRVTSEPAPFTLPHPTSTNGSGSGFGASWRLCLGPYLRGQLGIFACRI